MKTIKIGKSEGLNLEDYAEVMDALGNDNAPGLYILEQNRIQSHPWMAVDTTKPNDKRVDFFGSMEGAYIALATETLSPLRDTVGVIRDRVPTMAKILEKLADEQERRTK